MSTVRELKEALETEQTKAVELADKAISSIDTLLNLSMWSLGVLAVAVGLIAIFGFGYIKNSAKRAAINVAKDEMTAYISSKDFVSTLNKAVSEEVKGRLDNKFILAHISKEAGSTEPDPFPSPEEAKK